MAGIIRAFHFASPNQHLQNNWNLTCGILTVDKNLAILQPNTWTTTSTFSLCLSSAVLRWGAHSFQKKLLIFFLIKRAELKASCLQHLQIGPTYAWWSHTEKLSHCNEIGPQIFPVCTNFQVVHSLGCRLFWPFFLDPWEELNSWAWE